MKFFFIGVFSFLLFAFGFPVLAQTNLPEKIYNTVEQMPEFKGGNKAMFEFLGMNTRYPMEAQRDAITGTAFVAFVIDSTGHIKNPEIIKSASPILDAEAMRVINIMPPWNPGRQFGKPVAVKFTLPIKFEIQQNKANEDSKWKKNSPAKFPGGENAMSDYFEKNIKYPPKAYAKNIEGKVLVSFKVQKNGEVNTFKVENKTNHELSAEALRVLKAMPVWEPAVERGYTVVSHMVLEIPFVINKPGQMTNVVRTPETDLTAITFSNNQVTQEPQFPGGEAIMLKFIESNLEYPSDARRENIEGVTVVTFTVDTDGQVQNVTTLKPLFPSIDLEARRVVRSMPRWQPGMIYNQPVNVKYTLPINFSIPNKVLRPNPTWPDDRVRYQNRLDRTIPIQNKYRN